MSGNPAYAPGRSPFLRSGLMAVALAFALDQAVKLWLLYGYDLPTRGGARITPFFDLVLAWNTGISYGWFASEGPLGQWVLLALKAAAVVALGLWLFRAATFATSLGLGLIIGGALGNALDRLIHGAVVDFALFHAKIAGQTYNWYVFNLADVAIVAGVIALLYDTLVGGSAPKPPPSAAK